MSGGSASLSLLEGGSSVHERPDLGLQGLVLLAQFHGVAADATQLAHGFGRGGEPFDETTLLLAAKQLGLKAKVVAQPAARIGMAALPALALVPGGDAFIVAKVGTDQILIHDLVEKRPRSITPAEFEARYQGRLLQVASRASVLGDLAKFDFSWFIPAVVKYRKLMIEVFVVSFFIQLFALITPLFYQVVMDKVLVHNGLTTLDVIAIGLVSMAVFDVLLSGLRTYVFAHTTSKIDVELGARLFRHVLSLPLAYFESRRVGDTIARVRELENIRNFLTGQALTSVLDLFFTVVFLSVMFWYSGWLTLIVVLSLPLYATISGLITPVLRQRLNDKFARGADNQSFLVETVSGIGTVKAMAVDPRVTRTWDNQLAGYVSAGFNVTRIATLGQQGVQLVQKLTAVAVLFWGAKLVMEGKLSIGQLIAFNMLSGQVTAPIIRLAQLWQDFQQVGISVERLGDILNTRTEVPGSRLALPPIRGQVTFERVTFRYRPDAPEVLNGIELDIRPGEIIGIVGRSGSGKSTLTKLVQRLYTPERGRVLIDGQDLALADPAWLRRQLGVVLQENFLFNRSVRENIALTDPGMPLERVIHAAKLAGAHDFILELPEGYDTKVGEHGTGLSGGQRQRIAIARALIGDPRILILDEATSALDYESEHAVMQNMRAICKGRTVLIIAHRLSTVRQANRIVVVEKGRIVESGSHAELVGRPEGQYAHLYRLQQGTP
ncbi:type I secretion system permease/ATPase [Xanthomonas cucurbitae]|uniref:Type I secretion system permease/ATPase n=1 Tax=Xanthomonas cucurbitae TaxID=56453 RepID=A0A2S7DVD4_9XANT|nr:type I secretion system permease/ATPase [Xanthomonas cucurbitae]PPU77740.1 type I secretion system permease/ATPase [Xanthomonas cucurbitae]WDM67028.1 type I secretion system permease/ATPase [Xanthomonas cucurbitae]WDM70906.1 type I secretion system permease/ATPase [Xanthomonas cucurbitae]WDM79821.1 type I secretion system permease/ATPase [Xanthomonas cucurbitae]WDM83514.1 type I secretion system permease/ATPase [Xanthomonas cucurbitae]